ncbi:hypothetical protein D3C84_767720 [compost metagenome]
MKRLGTQLLSGLIFPVAPIAAIYLISALCRDIWTASFYTPGEDGGEFEPSMAIIGVPILLVLSALILAGLTVLTRWIEGRYEPGIWWRAVMGIFRIVLVAGSLMMFLVAAVFFMGDALGLLIHWQVAASWVVWGIGAGAFGVQQYQRLLR